MMKSQAEYAATAEASDNYYHGDYPDLQTVHVIDDEGKLFVFEVEAEKVQTVDFRAVEVEP